MGCFSLGWIESLIVNVVILVVVIGVLRLLIPWIIGLLGIDTGPLMAIINLILWGIIIIWLVYFVFSLLGCVGGIGLFPHR